MAQLAIFGGEPVRQAPWPSWPQPETATRATELAGRALTSGKWAGDGPMEQEFASRFAALQGARHGVCVSSGTTALQTALEAAGIGFGDEVVVPGMTWIATASAVLSTNGVPVFADLDPRTFCLDPTAAAAAITPRTKAIIPVHIFGAMADMDAINALAARHGLTVIEDAAHAHGSQWRTPDGTVRGAGALGRAGCFSFQASKSLSAGEGGIVLTNDSDFADRCWSYRNVGRARREGQSAVLGFNYRLSEVQAATLLAGLESLEGELATRDANGQYLNRRLAEIPGIRPARRDPRVVRQAYYGYIFAFDSEAWDGVSRSRFLQALKAEGVQAGGGFPPVYRMEYWQVRKERFPAAARYDPTSPDYQEPNLPLTNRLALEQQVTLPHSQLLGTREDVEDIARAVEKLYEQRAALTQQPAVAIA
ncbi:MAG: DegT/DnrJ/EryC1/StrS family aminotransferase [Chloroflexota bacterium]|nr:DegT/DnrJ/EryC1/StrS family aminotransferase [Chloroflexota bacterium]